jgi:HSP20 family protein
MNTTLAPFTKRFGFVSGSEVESILGQFLHGQCGADQPCLPHPAANIAETETTYEVTLDLPGMDTDDIEIELKQGVLTVAGERKQVGEEDGKDYRRVESAYGKFRRVVQFKKDIDGEKVEAEYNDGVLSVTVPKAKSAQAQRITIKK